MPEEREGPASQAALEHPAERLIERIERHFPCGLPIGEVAIRAVDIAKWRGFIRTSNSSGPGAAASEVDSGVSRDVAVIVNLRGGTSRREEVARSGKNRGPSDQPRRSFAGPAWLSPIPPAEVRPAAIVEAAKTAVGHPPLPKTPNGELRKAAPGRLRKAPTGELRNAPKGALRKCRVGHFGIHPTAYCESRR